MFHKEFYPTPYEVIGQMMAGKIIKGKTFLEPHAGKCDIVDYLFKFGAKDVLTCEINKDLQIIAKSKSNFICEDFFKLTRQQVSHVDYIVMNPPFSNAVDHIIHSWEIAPDGCEIISLCNYENVSDSTYRHTGKQRELVNLITRQGKKVNLGDCFSTAERKTNVKVGLIELYKPNNFEDEADFSDYFDLSEEYQRDDKSGIVSYDEIDALVSTYVNYMKRYNFIKSEQKEFYNITKEFVNTTITHSSKLTGQNDTFEKSLLKSLWKKVFTMIGAEKYMNSKLKELLNKFVENQSNVPFKKQNIYLMIETIMKTHDSRMNQMMLECYDRITNRHHDNRYDVKGWKTNESYLIGKKIILPVNCYQDGSDTIYMDHWKSETVFDDLHRCLYYITRKYADVRLLTQFFWVSKNGQNVTEEIEGKKVTKKINPIPRIKRNTWYDWGAFKIKFFFQGTAHVKFKDEKDWELLNRRISELKGNPIPDFVWRKEKTYKESKPKKSNTKKEKVSSEKKNSKIDDLVNDFLNL